MWIPCRGMRRKGGGRAADPRDQVTWASRAVRALWEKCQHPKSSTQITIMSVYDKDLEQVEIKLTQDAAEKAFAGDSGK